MNIYDSSLIRRVVHLDMDAFYASVELLRYPQLRGSPVIIGGSSGHPYKDKDGILTFTTIRGYRGRGVVTTSTYEARSLGVHSAMPMAKAAEKAPDAFLLPVDFPRYRDFSKRFKKAVSEITPLVENRGIDEIYIDITDHEESSKVLAERLQKAVFDATGLTCSIGIASNKLLAKMVSEFNKPNGVTILEDKDIRRLIWPLPVSRINGVGPKTTARLKSMGIETISQLAQTNPAVLQDNFGSSYASWLIKAAHGRDDSPVKTYSEPKSVSRETTFDRDMHVVSDKFILAEVLSNMCEQLEKDLQKRNMVGYTAGIKLRFDNFKTLTRDYTGSMPLRTAGDIKNATRQCLRRVSWERKIRLFGVRVSKLEKIDLSQQYSNDMQQLTLDYD